MGRARVASRANRKLGRPQRRMDTYLTRPCDTSRDQVFQRRNVQRAQFSALPLCNSQGKHAIGKLFGNRLRMCLQRQPTPQVPKTLEPFKLHFAGIDPFCCFIYCLYIARLCVYLCLCYYIYSLQLSSIWPSLKSKFRHNRGTFATVGVKPLECCNNFFKLL